MAKELSVGASSPMQQKAVDAFMQVDVLLLGGAMMGGKSFLAALLSSLYAMYPSSRIAVFRRTLEQMKKGGAIIDTFKAVYRLLGDDCKLRIGGNPPVGKIVRGHGAGTGLDDCCRIDFIQMSKDSDMESIRGSAFTLSIIEEALPDFTQDQIEMIMARTRSNAIEGDDNPLGCKVLITGNPDPDHFLCDLIKGYYLDEEGYPILERCGDLRYFYKFDGDYVWGSSKEELYEHLEELGAYANETIELTKEERLERILSFSFVQLTIRDNPIGRKNNPGYMAKLEAMDEVKKARNLFGNWFIRPENSTYFNRTMLRGDNGFRVASREDVPKGCTATRALDRAVTEPHEGNPTPNYTAFSPLILKSPDGESYYLLGNYHEECIDKPYRKSDKPVHGRIRRQPSERNNIIVKQALLDQQNAERFGYSKPVMGISKESGNGVGDYTSLYGRLIENNIKVANDLTSPNAENKKLEDFLAFSEACGNKVVYIVEDTFPPDTLEAWYKELEIFDGITKSSRTRFDDFVDATALAFNISKVSKRPYRTPAFTGQAPSPTLSIDLLK